MFRLFRVVAPEELADIAVFSGFRPGANTLLGKWFAESADAARRWGQLLYSGEVFHVIEVDIPTDVADLMFCLSMLDQIGPARYAEGDVLAAINQQHLGIREVP